MFEYLEELNLTRHGVLPESDLKCILSWLAGISPFRGKRPKGTDSFQSHNVGCSQDDGKTSAAEGSRTSPTRCAGQLKSFGCLYVRDQHTEMISIFYSLTSLVLSDLTELCSLAPLRHLRVLWNFTLMRAYCSNAEEILKERGNQLVFLNLNVVLDTDFDFISQNCHSFECLHLHISFPDFLILPPECINAESHSLPLIGLQTCRCASAVFD
jgi:hypothetical protein